MSTLLSQGGFGCVYYPGIKCSGNADIDKRFVTKLQRKDFNAENEIYIGSLIASINHYENYFIPIIKSCDIDLRKLDHQTIGDCKVVKSSAEINYLLMTLDYIKNKSLEDTIVTSDSKEIKRRSFAQLLNMYKYLLHGLELLVKKNIIHFDLKVENLLFSVKKGVPLIIDFGISIPKDRLTPENIKKYFYAFVPEYYVWPLEVHVINYLIHNTSANLTDTDIILISTQFSKSNAGLLLFSETFGRNYLLSCIHQLKKYIGIDRNKVINTLLSYSNTWDSYSLSIMFMIIFQKIFKGGIHFSSMFIFFTQLLIVNIAPNPEVRFTISETAEEYEKCFYIDDVQNYINLLDDLK